MQNKYDKSPFLTKARNRIQRRNYSIRDGKGNIEPLQEVLDYRHKQFVLDEEKGVDGVYMPDALDRKHPVWMGNFFVGAKFTVSGK